MSTVVTHGQLLGRSHELHRLVQFLRTPGDGVMIVSGVRGVGKSALVETAVRDIDIATARIRIPAQQDEPYISIRATLSAMDAHPVLRQVRPQLAKIISDGAATSEHPELIMDRMDDALREYELDDVLVVIDDIHRADPESRALWMSIMRRAQWRPWKYLCTVDADHDRGFTAEFETLHLDGVDLETSRELISQASDVPAALPITRRLHQVSGGVPVTVLDLASGLSPEVLRGAVPVPIQLSTGPPVAELHATQLDRVTRDELFALALFAHHDHVLSPILNMVTGEDWEVVDQLLQEKLITVSYQDVEPRTPALALVAWSRLTFPERLELHRRAQKAWADVDETEALYHACQSPIANSRVLADQVEEQCGKLRGSGELDRAYRLLTAFGTGRELSSSLLTLRADLELQLTYTEAALVTVAEALRTTADPRSALELKAIGIEAMTYRERDWTGLIPNADIDFPVSEPDHDAFRLVARSAHHLAFCGSMVEAKSTLALIAKHWPAATAANQVLFDQVEIELAEASEVDLGVRIHELSERRHDIEHELPWAFSASFVDDLLAVGDSVGARTLANSALGDHARRSPLAKLGQATANIHIELWEGNYLIADQSCRALMHRIETGIPSLPMIGARARTSAALGIPMSEGETTVSHRHHPAAREMSAYAADLGYALLIAGRFEEAAARLSQAMQRGRLLHQGQVSVLADLIEVYVILDRRDQARRTYKTCRPLLLDVDSDRARALLARIDALLSDARDLRPYFERALAACTPQVPDIERARTLIAFGRRQLERGKPNAAAVTLNEATNLMALHSMRGWVRHIAAINSIPRSPARRVLWQALTDQDQELGRMVADGKTYDQIAQELYISRRTVAARLKALYQRLDVKKRSELAALVASREGMGPSREATARGSRAS